MIYPPLRYYFKKINRTLFFCFSPHVTLSVISSKLNFCFVWPNNCISVTIQLIPNPFERMVNESSYAFIFYFFYFSVVNFTCKSGVKSLSVQCSTNWWDVSICLSDLSDSLCSISGWLIVPIWIYSAFVLKFSLDNWIVQALIHHQFLSIYEHLIIQWKEFCQASWKFSNILTRSDKP